MSIATLTPEARAKIAAILEGMHLPTGLGTADEACSIAAINLALTGELTDRIPDCMSEVIGRCIIRIQDAMPDALRNSREWKALLPLAAGTGRAHEVERLALILDHMWTVSLPLVQSIADANGFGDAWRTMLTEKTESAAQAAWAAASAASAAWAAAEAAWAAAQAACAASAASAASAAWAAAEAASAAARAANAEAWKTINPCALLERLIAVSEAA